MPLSGAALAILDGLDRDGKGGRVFPVSNMAMLMLLRRMGRGDLTVHGFRAAFSTWCAESGVDRDLAEMALAHTVGSTVERAYPRSDMFDRRRHLSEAWTRFCQGETEENVIQLRA